jgi:hypothetical protein
MGFADEAWPRLGADGDAAARQSDGPDLAPLLVPAPVGGDTLDRLMDWVAAPAREQHAR